MPVRPSLSMFKPYWTASDGESVRLYHGNVTAVLDRLPEKSVQCVVTSPPYWGLRSYATGDAKHLEIGSESRPDCLGWARGENCAEQDWANGCHVCRIVLVFREVRRVLRDDGVTWLNYGDTYANTGACGGASPVGNREYRETDRERQMQMKRTREDYGGLPSGNLVGVPWRVALALQADGWVLRQDVIWHKPSPMPESVRNRCTKAHEYLFLLTKSARYFYDAEEIKEKGVYDEGEELGMGPVNGKGGRATAVNGTPSGNEATGRWTATGTRNKRSVWTVSSGGYSGAHFATFPDKLIEPMVLVGTSARGACAKCGAPWRRVTERTPFTGPSDGRSSGVGGQPDQGKARLRKAGVSARDESDLSAVGKGPNRNGKGASTLDGTIPRAETVRWEPTCTCHGRFEKRTVKSTVVREADDMGSKTELAYTPGGNTSLGTFKNRERVEDEVERTETVYFSDLPLDRHPVVPCVVLDPFVGSGTTCAVAVRHGRRGWGIDLSEEYLKNHAVKRVTAELLSRPATAHLVPRAPVVKGWGAAMVMGGGRGGA